MNVIVSHIYATKSTGVCWRFAVIGNEVPVRKDRKGGTLKTKVGKLAAISGLTSREQSNI